MRERALASLLVALVVAGCGDDGSTATEGTSSTSGSSSTTAEPATGTEATTDDFEPGTEGSSAATEEPTTTADPTDGESTTDTDGELVVEGHFIAVGDGGVRARSVDGVEWESVVGSGMLDLDSEMAPPDALRALAVGEDFIVAVGGGGTFFTANTMIMRSEDGGLTWQEDVAAMPEGFKAHKLYGVAYADGVLVAAGIRGKQLRSEDKGLTWTEIKSQDTNSRLLAVAAEGSTFVVVGWTSSAHDAPHVSMIVTSTDKGVTWGPPDNSFEALTDIAHGNGAFVAVGPAECILSSDGMAWSDCGLVSEQYFGVDFAGGQFIATTIEGVSTSPDGVEWSEPVMPLLGPPTAIARGNGRYVGLRWTDRGWASRLDEWSYGSFAAEPLRAIVFVPQK